MAAKDRLLDGIQARLQGVTIELVTAEVNDAVEEYFERSSAWLHNVSLTLKADRTSYVLQLPKPNARIVHVHYLGDGSTKMRLVPALIGGVQSTSVLNFVPPYTLKASTARTEDYPVSVLVALTTDNVDDVPDALLVAHREGIKDAALSRLFAMPGRPWTSEKSAKMHTMRATRAIADARRVAQRNFGGPNWTFPFFA